MKKINVLISTFFGYGYLTKIPGTITSLVTTVFIYIAYEHLGYTDLKFSLIFFLLLFFYSFYAVKDTESEFKIKDPRQIVIDEVLGQSMPLILVLYLSQKNQLSLTIHDETDDSIYAIGISGDKNLDTIVIPSMDMDNWDYGKYFVRIFGAKDSCSFELIN